MNLGEMEEGVRLILKGMGLTKWEEDSDFKDTPARVARMYEAMLTPETNNWTTFPATQSDLIVLRGHKVVGICPHHLQPVEIRAYVAYIPNKTMLGLSKLARVVEERLTRPITQENLAHEIAVALEQRLDPKGCGVVLAGTHGCMRFRGVETEADVVSSVMKGVLLLNPSARAEFFSLIGKP